MGPTRTSPSGPKLPFLSSQVGFSGATNAALSVAIPFTGAKVGDVPIVSLNENLPAGLALAGARTVFADDSVTVFFYNHGPATTFSSVGVDVSLIRRLN